MQEEISQGAGRIAGFLGLSNLIMFYDSNRVQLSTNVDAVDAEDVCAKYAAWGWNVIEIDGTDPEAIAKAIETAQAETKRPTIIVGHTVMGRGAVTASGELFEGKCSTHGQPLSKSGADYAKTMEHLGADPANPWIIPADVQKLYADRNEQLRKLPPSATLPRKHGRRPIPSSPASSTTSSTTVCLKSTIPPSYRKPTTPPATLRPPCWPRSPRRLRT